MLYSARMGNGPTSDSLVLVSCNNSIDYNEKLYSNFTRSKYWIYIILFFNSVVAGGLGRGTQNFTGIICSNESGFLANGNLLFVLVIWL